MNFKENESLKYNTNNACIKSGQEAAVLVCSGEKTWDLVDI